MTEKLKDWKLVVGVVSKRLTRWDIKEAKWKIEDYVKKISCEEARPANESDHARSGACWVTMTWKVCGGWKQWRKNGVRPIFGWLSRAWRGKRKKREE